MNKAEERMWWARCIREIQHMSGETVEDLSERLGVAVREVAYWKSGKRRPIGINAVRVFEYRAQLFMVEAKRI